jgi:hypothetical protein
MVQKYVQSKQKWKQMKTIKENKIMKTGEWKYEEIRER